MKVTLGMSIRYAILFQCEFCKLCRTVKSVLGFIKIAHNSQIHQIPAKFRIILNNSHDHSPATDSTATALEIFFCKPTIQ